MFHSDGITPAKRAAISRARWFHGRAKYVYTDENGKYTIIGLSGGRKQVLADLDGYTVISGEVDVQVGKAVENIDFILGQGKISVKGKILSAIDNREIENATIFFLSRKTGEKYSGGEDKSDNNGNYSILGFLEPGKFKVSIIHDEFVSIRTEVELKPGENNLDFEMQPEKASEKKMSRTSADAMGSPS
ncbi:MAG: hypothetical protein GY757_10825, partial [bacterium]|nr:hypothetical protein [bacterium]